MKTLLVVLLAMLASPAQAQQVECLEMSDEMADKVRAVMLNALDEALRDHVKHMFLVWMKDEGDAARARARHGTRLGVRSYIRVREVVLNTQWNCRR
jgi:hypothetical protein